MIVDKTKKIVTMPRSKNKVDKASWILLERAVPRGCLVVEWAIFGILLDITDAFLAKKIPVNTPLKKREIKMRSHSFLFHSNKFPISPKTNRGLE